MVDEVIDVLVVEQLIFFIQFVNLEIGVLEVYFLFIQNVLENLILVNVAIIVKLIREELLKDGLEINKFSSLVSDGVSVMIGFRNGVVVKLGEIVLIFINIYCICYRFVFVCNDVNDNLILIS